MLRRLQAWRDSAEGTQWCSKREQLPVGQIRQALLEALTQHDVAVVGGDTGCGKTTQVNVITSHQRSCWSAPSKLDASVLPGPSRPQPSEQHSRRHI